MQLLFLLNLGVEFGKLSLIFTFLLARFKRNGRNSLVFNFTLYEEKKFLRSMGHTLKPVVMIGQHGLTESVLAELESTMEKHELLKIKVRA